MRAYTTLRVSMVIIAVWTNYAFFTLGRYDMAALLTSVLAVTFLAIPRDIGQA